MTLRYGLASILWLCIGLLQVHRHHTGCSKNSNQCLFKLKVKWKEWCIALLQVIYFTLHERFVKNKIHQFVDLCSISNVSIMVFPNNICMSQICECCHFLNRFHCCSSPILALGITSMGIQYTDTRIQTWRKWTAIWKEKPCVFQQLHRHGCSTASWHYCDMCIIIILTLFSMWRSLCVGSEVSFPTLMYRHFRCLSPGTFGHSMKEYGIWATGCGLCVDLEDLRPRKTLFCVIYSVVLSRELGQCGQGIQAQPTSLSRTPAFTTPWTTSWDHS